MPFFSDDFDDGGLLFGSGGGFISPVETSPPLVEDAERRNGELSYAPVTPFPDPFE